MAEQAKAPLLLLQTGVSTATEFTPARDVTRPFDAVPVRAPGVLADGAVRGPSARGVNGDDGGDEGERGPE
jgi:hypothetical protein